ncbi:hypothetical protein M0R72_21250 [Candidatus Pacearchaeota archaeon]|jgi:hypothetical protein|nr:hypothetical protein [Candidatus Pacearchaeota archaeon]
MKRKWFNVESLRVAIIVVMLVGFVCLALLKRDGIQKFRPAPDDIREETTTTEKTPETTSSQLATSEAVCNTLFDEWLRSIKAIADGDSSLESSTRLFEAARKVHGFRVASGHPVFLVENTNALKRHRAIIHLHQLAATLLDKPESQKIRLELIQGIQNLERNSSKTQ